LLPCLYIPSSRALGAPPGGQHHEGVVQPDTDHQDDHHQVDRLKGNVSREEYFLKVYNNRYFLYNLFVLFDEKIKLNVLACFFEITY
jgi:hypothetical protein